MLSVLVFLLTISPASRGGVTVPQTAPPPSKIDAPGELDKLGQSCGAFQVVGCAEELLTGQPVHVGVQMRRTKRINDQRRFAQV